MQYIKKMLLLFKLVVVLLAIISLFFIMTGCNSKKSDGVNDIATINETAQRAFTSKTHSVDILNYEFTPDLLIINSGDKIIFTNLDDIAHTVTSVEGTALNSKKISSSQSYTVMLMKPGKYFYYSKGSPSMKGTIIVR